MDKIYLNELSLRGQFGNMEEFLEAVVPLMRCLRYIQQHNGKVYKYSEFYKRKITADKTWNDLRGIRGDKATRLKRLLLSTTDSPPFWDIECDWVQDVDSKYYCNGSNVSMSSVAEATEAKGMLLSFQLEEYEDKILVVLKNEKEKLEVFSVASMECFIEYLWKSDKIDIHEYLCNKYEGTRLDFTELEEEYGLHNFEKEEIRDCLQTFDKFVKLDNWEAVFRDQGLRYKKYSPSSKEDNWFLSEEYTDKVIDKFRCINPKRCFGYREGDVFHVLRMERDHKISDKG